MKDKREINSRPVVMEVISLVVHCAIYGGSLLPTNLDLVNCSVDNVLITSYNLNIINRN
jgi:hypothetical protein